MQVLVRVMSPNVEIVRAISCGGGILSAQKAKMIGVVSEGNRGNFDSRNLAKVNDVIGSGMGVADNVLRLGENLRNIVPMIMSQR